LFAKAPDFPAGAFASYSSYSTRLRIVGMLTRERIRAIMKAGLGCREWKVETHRTSLIVDSDLWDDFNKVARRNKTDRASLLREFIAQQVAEHQVVPATASVAA